MDVRESHAEQWLQHQGYTDIRFEPEGDSQTPDFGVNGNDIAVEVRRLNWMFGDENTGLESVEKPLERDIRAGLAAAEQPPPGYRGYVSCDLYHTELPDKNTVVDEVQKAANQYVNRLKASIRHGQHLTHSINESTFGMKIEFITGTSSATNEFKLMGVTAGIEETGFVLGDSIDNINRCIDEKTEKIRDKHNLYSEWWLILVEHNVHATMLREPDELQTVRNSLTDTSFWSRIIILSNLEGVPELDLI